MKIKTEHASKVLCSKRHGLLYFQLMVFMRPVPVQRTSINTVSDTHWTRFVGVRR